MEAVSWDFVFSLSSSLDINWNGLVPTCRLSQEKEKGKVDQFADHSNNITKIFMGNIWHIFFKFKLVILDLLQGV